MRRMLRSGAALWMLLLIPLTACETKRVSLELPAFGDGSVEGVWLWRLSDVSGAWERACRIPLDYAQAGERETVTYTQECEDERAGFQLSSEVERPGAPETVRVSLWYLRWEEPGTYKVSAYGPSGESALSETTLDL